MDLGPKGKMDLGPKGKKAIVSGATPGMGPGRRIVNLLADNGFTKRVQR